MGASSSGGGGGGNNKTYSSSREIGLMNQYKKPKQRAIDTKKMKDDAFREQGAYNTRRSLDKLPSFLPGAAILKGLSPKLEANSKKTRDFFVNKVLTDKRGLKNFGYTKEQFQKLSMAKQNKIYGNYITTRRDNKTDGYGTVINEGNDRTSDTQNKPDLKIGKFPNEGGSVIQPFTPTEAEVSQSEAADADDIYTRRKKSKARGRSMMTLTSSKGVTDNKLTLGKPSLLGS